MNSRTITIVFCSLLLSGCQLLNTQSNPVTSERLQGQLRQIDNDWQLTPCNSSTALQVEFSAQWTEALQQCTQEQSPSCFADLEVEPGPTPAPVTHVHRIQIEGHSCNDAEFAHLHIRASGNEPFWNIRLNDQGLVLQQPGQPTLALPYIQEQLGNGLQYISSQVDHQTLQLWISEQPCTDSMSGAWHALSARLDWQGQTLHGCAYYGAQHSLNPTNK